MISVEEVRTIANTGGNAFPSEVGTHGKRGATLRDYFAVRAMAAIITKLPVFRTHEEALSHISGVTAGAYAYADSMLKARVIK